MEKIYADLVFKGLKAIEQVPPNLRDGVKKLVEKLNEEQAIREETERAQAENAFLDESLYKGE